MGLTLRGPSRQGSTEMDEGALTHAVVARFAAEDGEGGQVAAAAVLPARRALWRIVEAYAPRLLADALRARLDRNDQTGRGGVRELRRALADWLDPPPACGYCGRLMSPDLMRDPTTATCPARVRPPPAPSTRNPKAYPTPRRPRTKPDPACSPRRGRRLSYSLRVARCGTLSLFSPLHLDPACGAAVKMMRHGGALAYDLVVDRDARILFAVSALNSHTGVTPQHGQEAPATVHAIAPAEPADPQPLDPRGKRSAVDGDKHATDPSTARLIATARARLDHAIDRAIRANGRIALGTQVRYFSPKGSVTRADLVQASTLGLRRALLDYDPDFRPAGKPAGVKITSYAINWCHQSMGEAFAARGLVNSPPWVAALHGRVEALGLSPAGLLAGVLAVSEARHSTTEIEVANGVRIAPVLFAAKALADMLVTPVSKRDEDAAKVLVILGGVGFATAATRKPAKAKKPVSDEKSREQVALVVAELLGLDCTGGALLTALRHGATPVVVGVSVGGERDDAGGDGDAPGGGGGGGSHGLEHLHADPDGESEEDRAAEELADRRRVQALFTALESLRAADPEAAEAVRRRHGMDASGDPETLEEIGERLRSTGRVLCREAVRVAYKRGMKFIKSHASSTLPAEMFEAAEEGDGETASSATELPVLTASSTRRRWRAPRVRPDVRPTTSSTAASSPATSPAFVPTHDAPESTYDPEAWAPAAMVF